MLTKFIPETASENLDYDNYAQLTENYSGSDMRLLAKEACMKPLRRLIR